MKLASLRESFTNSRYSLWHCFAFAHNFVCIEKLKMNATNWSCKTICTIFGSAFTQVFLPNRWIPTVSAQNIVSFDFNWRQLFAQILFTNARNFKFILHICWLEGNIHVFFLKSKLETNSLFGDNVFSLVMILSSCWECRRLQVLETSFENEIAQDEKSYKLL